MTTATVVQPATAASTRVDGATAIDDRADCGSAALPSAPVPAGSLKAKAMRGAAWTIGGYGASQVLRLASNILLTRLLFPEAFGLMALVNVFMQGLAMFSDIGIGPGVIQSKRQDRVFLDTAWTIQAVRGIALSLFALILAWPVAQFYHEPQLVWIFPVAGVTAAIAGFGSTSLFTLGRDLALVRLTLLELVSQALSISVMLVWVWHDQSVRALLAGGISGSLFKTVASHFLEPGPKNRLRWDHESRQALFQIGRWIFLSSILTFLGSQSDRLVFGRVQAMGWLGVYNVALTLASMPAMAIIKVGGSVTFPAFSRVLAAGGDLRSAFYRARLPMVAGSAFLVTCLVLGGPAFVRVVYDARYHDAGFLLQLLAIGVWFQVLESFNTALLLALGETRWVFVGNAVKTVALFVLIAAGYAAFGAIGAVAALGVADALRYIASAWAVRRHGFPTSARDAGLTLFIAATVVGGLAAQRLAVHAAGPGSAMWQALAVIGVAGTCWSAWLLIMFRDRLGRKGFRRAVPGGTGDV